MEIQEMMAKALENLEKTNEVVVFRNSPESQKKYPCNTCKCDRPAMDSKMPFDWRICGDCAYNFYYQEKEKLLAGLPKFVVEKMRRMNFPEKVLKAEYKIPDQFQGKFSLETGLFLYGDTGTGKTTTLYLMLKDYIQRVLEERAVRLPEMLNTREIMFVNVPSMLLRLQSMFRSDEDPNKKIIELAEMDVLILDDIGAEKMSEWVRQTLYVLINEREMNCKPTYITSNKSLEQLNQEIDPRIASRIAGMCNVIHVAGIDRRIRK